MWGICLFLQQVTQQMQIPLSYADAVIGTSGSNISYTRRLSGATVTIQETRGVPGEMTVEVSGTGSQVQTAMQLIQVPLLSLLSCLSLVKTRRKLICFVDEMTPLILFMTELHG